MPRYAIPPTVWAQLVWAILLRKRRSFASDALRMTATLTPALRVVHPEHLPTHGPAVLTCNHYAKSGFFSPFIGAAISAAVHAAGGPEVCWVMTDAWTGSGLRGELLRAASHWALLRVARTYGFLTMPPMPPRPEDTAARAVAVRRLMHYARGHPTALIGLVPEGADQPGGILSLPPPGVGRLLVSMCHLGYEIRPAGIYEVSGGLVVQFGPPYRLDLAVGDPRAQADLEARCRVMQAVASCLPPGLRGDFEAV